MIALIDCGSSGVGAAAKALIDLRYDHIITINEIDILKSDKIILSGEGDITFAIKQLHKNNLFTMLRVCKKPLLGIGVGMQILADHVKESNISGLGIFPGPIEKFDPEISKISFTGFHNINIKTNSKIFKNINAGEKFYFEHSYYLPINIYTTSAADNNTTFSASVETGNYYGVQFHPEKSGEAGMRLLKNFIEL